MGVIVNGKKFSGKLSERLISEIIAEIKKLPEPAVMPLHSVPMEDNEIGLCLQREAIYLDKFQAENRLRFLGSKGVYDCIVIYARSETDHLVIHHDDESIDFVPFLNKFNYQENITISLAGGLPSKDKERSEHKLHKIISALYKATEKLKIDITILNQKIMENNAFSETDRYEFVFNQIMEKAAIVFRQYFKKPLDEKKFSERSTADFLNRSRPKTNEMINIMMLLAPAVEIFDIERHFFLEQSNEIFRRDIKDEEHFIRLVDSLFSQEGFALHDEAIKGAPRGYRAGKLVNFVFDIYSGNIIVINAHTKTPNENHREMVVADPYQKFNYFLCYDGERGIYPKPPKLSNYFLQGCQLIQGLIKDDRPIINKAQVAEKYGMPVLLSNPNRLAKFIKTSLEKLPQASSVFNQFTVFHSSACQNDFYYEEEKTNQNLLLLNKLTGLKFIAKKRHYPQHTMDAIFVCDTNKASEVQELLDQHHIPSTLIKFADTNDHFVCVQAINVRGYGDQVFNAYKNRSSQT